jgi:putative redox protein
MATSKVIYSGELRTNLSHLSSGDTIITDAPIDNHGKGQAFSPTDLAATSLAACMLTVLGIHAQKNNINMDGSYANVQKVMNTEGSRRIVQIDIDLTIVTTEIQSDKEKIILERVAKNCPVALSLHPDVNQNINVKFEVL